MQVKWIWTEFAVKGSLYPVVVVQNFVNAAFCSVGEWINSDGSVRTMAQSAAVSW